ncbi:MlaE family ABC transporter permease [Methylosarcina fibrata]|uniref:MlaE family ABC transporter permease n=1 Tax=Methylosarcina fibrata TaxID=105972 RepID=UPI00037A6539|nr:ABC transporter permease [Methylosarcina fibrata]
MTDRTAYDDLPPLLEIIQRNGETHCIKLSGNWNLRNLSMTPGLRRKIRRHASDKTAVWDLTSVNLLDNGSALIIWLAWGERFPAGLRIKPEHRRMLESWQSQAVPPSQPVVPFVKAVAGTFNRVLTDFWEQFVGLVAMWGQLILDLFYLILHPREIPWPELSNTIYESGVRALGITALVGFLIGIVLSYLSALQLRMFGAEIYIINILGLSIIRELGPLLAAILVAGRSGSAMTAQIGIMRVTEELDALSAMGISHSLRLILPKVAALILVLPLLTVWTNGAALLGGMFSAQNTLDISYQQFFQKLPDTVPLVNIFIGLGKSAVFGMMIALIACHFGFRIQPNTESLGNETTNSVVAAITVVIMVDALFAILFMDVGMP